jgi:hypothetical protein
MVIQTILNGPQLAAYDPTAGYEVYTIPFD